jgi:hypothetical protein
LEAIFCVLIGDGRQSRMWLQVNEEIKLEQIIKQAEKVPDVLWLKRHDGGHEVFVGLHRFAGREIHLSFLFLTLKNRLFCNSTSRRKALKTQSTYCLYFSVKIRKNDYLAGNFPNIVLECSSPAFSLFSLPP